MTLQATIKSLNNSAEYRLIKNFDIDENFMESFELGAIPYSIVNNDALKGDQENPRFAQGTRSDAWGYVTENTKYRQAHFDHEDRETNPAWITDIADYIRDNHGLTNIVCTITRQNPGNSLPPHVDMYCTYREEKDIPVEDANNVIRYLVFLEDWKTGHFLQFGNSVCCYWEKGDCISWDNGLRHLSTNAGTEPKFAMQITGVQK
jgi:hypothetical protein